MARIVSIGNDEKNVVRTVTLRVVDRNTPDRSNPSTSPSDNKNCDDRWK